MIRVLVADDQAAVRDGFAALIAAQPAMTVAATADNGRKAVDLARSTLPHLVLMDVRMPILDGLQATKLICEDRTLERTRVLVLTTFDLDEYVYTALRAGASGFLLKDTPRRELLQAIEVVAAGDALISPGITRRLITEFAARRDPQDPPAALADLTERERDVLLLVARCLSNDEIAGRLVISPLTAKTHVRNVLRKLDCHDRAELVALAYETQLIKPGETGQPAGNRTDHTHPAIRRQ
jgi:DNA-binding NarL/FixJ family response regulator